MFRLLTYSLTSCGMVLSFTVFGQGLSTAPLGTMPMEYNPSFAGQVGSPRISMNAGYTQNRYFLGTLSNIDRNSRSWGSSVVASYDQFVPVIRSGISVTTNYGSSHTNSYQFVNGVDYALNSSVSMSSLTIAVAPKFSLKGKYTLSPSVDLAFISGEGKRMLNQVPDTLYGNINGRLYELESRIGVLFNSNKFYIGYTIYLFNNKLKSSTYNPSIGVTRWYTFESYVQVGYTFQKNSESKFSFTPQLLIGIEKSHFEPKVRIVPRSFMFNLRYKQFIWGLNTQGIHVGWQTEKFRLMLTNAFNLNNKKNSSYYAGNLSLRYIFSSPDSRTGRGW